MDEQHQMRMLEALVIDNPQLDTLESRIAEFNIFEAMGAVRQELRHSDFLAFLLNPAEKHGLGDAFLKRFLVCVLSEAEAPPVPPLKISVTDLTDAIVERESQHIDILIHDAASGLVCVIENKIYSGEHTNQLDRYLQSARHRFNESTIIPVFLTPDGIPPADEDSQYIPFSYGQVSAIMDHVRRANESMLGADVNTMIDHYVTMLRRHIVSESDIAELCRQIYRTHRTAIDLIVQHMPDTRQELADYLAGLVTDDPRFAGVRTTRTYVDFVLKEWEARPEFNVGTGWPNSTTTLALQFRNTANELSLCVELGPVQAGHEHICDTIYASAKANRSVFKNCNNMQGAKWTMIFKQILLRHKDHEDASVEELAEIIEPKWNRFVADTLPKINAHLMQIEFKQQ